MPLFRTQADCFFTQTKDFLVEAISGTSVLGGATRARKAHDVNPRLPSAYTLVVGGYEEFGYAWWKSPGIAARTAAAGAHCGRVRCAMGFQEPYPYLAVVGAGSRVSSKRSRGHHILRYACVQQSTEYGEGTRYNTCPVGRASVSVRDSVKTPGSLGMSGSPAGAQRAAAAPCSRTPLPTLDINTAEPGARVRHARPAQGQGGCLGHHDRRPPSRRRSSDKTAGSSGSPLH